MSILLQSTWNELRQGVDGQTSCHGDSNLVVLKLPGPQSWQDSPLMTRTGHKVFLSISNLYIDHQDTRGEVDHNCQRDRDDMRGHWSSYIGVADSPER